MPVNEAQSAEIPETLKAAMGGAFAAWTAPAGQAIPVASRTWQVCAHLTNMGVLETDEGLVLVDCGMPKDGQELLALVRSVSSKPVHTVIFTHGHIDHAFGLRPFLDEAERRPQIVAHRRLVDRFVRYARTAGYNAAANTRQSGGPGPGRSAAWWPREDSEFFWPDTVYDDSLTLHIGGEEIVLNHAEGETDDATWVWVPGRKLVCVGDLWIDAFPNAGNPQKVQRYAEEWAQAARLIAGVGAEAMIAGHGMPVRGSGEILGRFTDLARYLEYIVDYTVDALNAGKDHNEIVTEFRAPADLAAKPYLQPWHDRPEFVVRNLIRRYGGWWNGRAADLLPPPTSEHAHELVSLAGGPQAFVDRAMELADKNLPLACQLAEWAALGAPDSAGAHRCVADVFERRLGLETAYQARGIYQEAVNKARARLAELDDS